MNPYAPDVLDAFFVRGVRIWLCQREEYANSSRAVERDRLWQ